MATLEELTLIREARAGRVRSQLELGKRYIDGSEGLPRNTDAALHWVASAAMQGDLDACILIARHFTLELALQTHDAQTLCAWFERAFAAGETKAGLAYARLVLDRRYEEPFASLYDKAISALCAAAHSGLHEAEWRWAEILFERAEVEATALQWATRAALGGVAAARHQLSERAWQCGDADGYLGWALPLARQALSNSVSVRARRGSTVALTAEQYNALSRCARILAVQPGADEHEVFELWELAATQGVAQEQYSLGLWLAKMEPGRHTTKYEHSLPNLDLAIQWLILAGRQGLADAWFAVSKIYANPWYLHANADLVRHYRHKAAERGHRQAQYECGLVAWNADQERATNAVRAIHWLELASEQGCEASDELLRTIRQMHPETLCDTSLAESDTHRALLTV